jgi:retinol dehydrogenase-14
LVQCADAARARDNQKESITMRGEATHCVVTGGTSGIGRAVASQLARQGAHVAIVGRRADAGEQALAEIRAETGSGRVELLLADLSSQASVRRLAGEIEALFDAVHLLVHNAGVVEPHRRSSEDGIEATLAINHLAPFLLTQLLLPRLEAGSPARIVTVSSQVHATHATHGDLEDFEGSDPYQGLQAYRRSKLANILFTRELSERLEGSGVTANCLHPGVVQTRLLARFEEAQQLEQAGAETPLPARGLVLPAPIKWVVDRIRWRLMPSGLSSCDEAAGNIVHAATAPELEGRSGLYLVDRAPADPAPIATDRRLAAALWGASARWTGVDWP